MALFIINLLPYLAYSMIKGLKYLFQNFATFIRLDFKWKAYVYTAIVILISIIWVYTTKTGWGVGKGRLPFSNYTINNILLFNILYFSVAIPVLIIQNKYKNISKPHFHLKGLLIVTILAVSDIFPWQSIIDTSALSNSERYFVFKVLGRSSNLLLVLPVLILLRLLVDKKVKGLYGLCRGNHHVKAYMSLYIIVIPILICIAFTPDFLSYYPSGKPWRLDGQFGNAAWINTTLFEIVYMCDFIMVELIFRGALVIGMGIVMGRSAVLPMITIYVALHFGKPLAETISAAFGGLFLGALAYQSRHIWGGVIIHMGIALAIELIRITQYAIWGI